MLVASAAETRELAQANLAKVDSTRAALLDGTMTLAISHPLERLATEAIRAMQGACTARAVGRNWTRVVPFEIFTRENI